MDYLILLSSIVAGAVTVVWLRLGEHSHVRLMNAFSGAYLLALTFLHLLPELYRGTGAPTHESTLYLGALILAGFFVQILLDYFSMGLEHGHAHHLHGRLPIGMMTGLCLHAFLEAIALGDPLTHHDPASRRLLLWSIVLHNYPVSIALLGMLLYAGLARGRALGLLGVFAAMAPAGLLLSSHSSLANHTRELMAIVIGIFMHISTTILFENSESHRFNLAKGLAILVGVGLGAASVILH
ncbi:MAG TPA: ZIP family metal transporter [Verrucomicrobiae bacterium]|jgi:zinc transporter ZupT